MPKLTTTGAPRVPIAAEYPSEDEALEILLFRHLISSGNSHYRGGGEDMYASIPSEIKSQNDQANGKRLEKPCKKIGQKSDKAECKLLKRELLSCEDKVLQNLYSAVRSRPAPPTT